MWKHLLAVAHRFGFTRNETLVLVFLVAVITAGSVIPELRSAGTGKRTDIRTAYRQADSVFVARSSADVTKTPAEETTGSRTLSDQSSPGDGTHLVHINTAGEKELTSLPGIGPVTAERIMEYRTTHGPFRSVEDLIKVKSIGAKKLERIRQLITIE